MFKTSDMLFLYAETSVHVGGGQAFGAVDLPIQRERHTGYPVGPASGIKGAARAWFRHQHAGDDRFLAAFGPDSQNGAPAHAGAVSFTDARLLLFPVRSVKGVFAWTTCPTILARFRRDLAAAGQSVPWSIPDPNGQGQGGDRTMALGTDDERTVDGGQVMLEEYAFDFEARAAVQELADWLKEHAFSQSAEEYEPWRERLATHLLVLPDDAFRDFAEHSTEVQARVKLGEGKSTDTEKGGNLFYQENLPSDALFYCRLAAGDDRSGALDGPDTAADVLAFVRELDGKRLQIGGDESVGKGVTFAHFLPNGSTSS